MEETPSPGPLTLFVLKVNVDTFRESNSCHLHLILSQMETTLKGLNLFPFLRAGHILKGVFYAGKDRWLDVWMTSNFTSISTVFQSYQVDVVGWY